MSNDREYIIGRGRFSHDFEDIISTENLLAAWEEFLPGKRGKKDVQQFQHHLMNNILALHNELESGEYAHGPYYSFKINDPKPRDIHKANVRDRLLHHALYRTLYPFFDRTFISDSYSCRKGKGTHRAMLQFQAFAAKVSKNNTRTCWVLKCDIRKFFASIDHQILKDILGTYIKDKRLIQVFHSVIDSFSSTAPGKGLPLGNLTSQLLVNIYMNEFDQFAKHTLKAHRYVRYADDFIILSDDVNVLYETLPRIQSFLSSRLALSLHPNKVHIETIASGVDFLGWIHFPTHRVLRTSSKRHMLRNLKDNQNENTRQSYRGMLSHGDAHILARYYLAS